ncbi:MAG: UDP-N-acetylmuramoyl-tripeptide--D-alanyl-D-alanine ligase [Coriobacteriales bacterium]
MQLTVQEVMDAIGGILHSDEESTRSQVTGITWDSRAVQPGDLFLALPGERVDGNDYVAAAIGGGAAMVVCTREPGSSALAIAGEFACPVAVVEDGYEAIARLAAYWRSTLRAVVVGVTGSTGKTSTKDLLFSVLSQRYRTVATQGNRNNELGMPATVLGAPADTEALVVEMGMRGMGQIAAGCRVAKPDVAVVTNVGVCHMELLGSRENIARAKGEMIAALPPTGMAVVNADDDMTGLLLESAGAPERELRVTRFGLAPDADVRAEQVEIGADGCARFMLCIGTEEPVAVALGIPGEHNVGNALAAAAVGSYLGESPQQIADGLAQAQASSMRMELTRADNGLTVLNDAYNANPDSMRAALATLGRMSCPGRRIAVLGDMGELGEQEAELHRQVGRCAAAAPLDLLLCVGPLAEHIAAAALDAQAPFEVAQVADVPAAIAFLKERLEPQDTVLVKASRFMGFEKIAEEIVS